MNGSGPIFRRRERALLTAGETAMAACKAAIDKWLEPQESDGDGGSVAPNAGPFFLNPDRVPAGKPISSTRIPTSFMSLLPSSLMRCGRPALVRLYPGNHKALPEWRRKLGECGRATPGEIIARLRTPLFLLWLLGQLMAFLTKIIGFRRPVGAFARRMSV